jgi:DNA polymerase III subunit epsilon
LREVVIDTETTGLEPADGHRIVEIGACELMNHVPTGRTFHVYVNPERNIPDDALAVHGLTNAFLREQPVFAEVVDDLLAFLEVDRAGGPAPARLIAHNAGFDIAFINMELTRIGRAPLPQERIVDTLLLARQRFPGAPNSLDALCRRFAIDLAARTLHGALLDSQLLADVYLMLIGGRQPGLDLVVVRERRAVTLVRREPRPPRPHAPTPAELAAHAAFLDQLAQPIWRA